MLVRLLAVPRVVVIMGAMIARMLMAVVVLLFLMGMRMAVLVRVLVGMLVAVLVAVGFALMRMGVRVLMGVFMLVLMVMLVVAFHGGSSFWHRSMWRLGGTLQWPDSLEKRQKKTTKTGRWCKARAFVAQLESCVAQLMTGDLADPILLPSVMSSRAQSQVGKKDDFPDQSRARLTARTAKVRLAQPIPARTI
jgi:energy-coupling factor transporter transmembrane protein EcfT